jgi:hypothetical protein
LLTKRAVRFDLCEEILGEPALAGVEAAEVGRVLLAAGAAAGSAGGLLPPGYEVTLARRGAATAVARRYVAGVGERYFDEGLKRLKERVLGGAA